MKKQSEQKEEYSAQMRNLGMPVEHQNWMSLGTFKTLEEAQIKLEDQKRYLQRGNKNIPVGGGLSMSIESDVKDKFELRIRKRLVTPYETVNEIKLY